jgi:hypothetical protein
MLIAFLTDSICPSKREKPPEDISAALKRAGLDAGREGKRPVAAQRLSTAMAQLERIQAERQRLGDPGFGRVAEDRIVWSELLELELQDTDHQVSPHHGEDTGSQD